MNEIYIPQKQGNGPRILRKITPSVGQVLRFDSNGKLSSGGSVAKAYSASGALTIQPGIHVLTKAGVGAMTLAAPTATTHDGVEMTIISSTAQAHTVTQTTPGFNGGSTASDVATFGGAIGDAMTIVAYNGVWLVRNLRNVTLG